MEIRAGNTIYNIPNTKGFDLEIEKLIEIEENRVLELLKFSITCEEHIILHFVRMYILRWAIPVIEIENNGILSPELIPQIQKRFWLCMYGRALDDLHDKDSHFFLLSDSIILLSVYSALLKINPFEKDSQELIIKTANSLTFSKKYIIPEFLTFDNIQKDVCVRVNYFLSESCVINSLSNIVNRFVGVFLGFTDLEDCLVDGFGNNNATLMSSHLFVKLADDDKKIHLTADLLTWYKSVYQILAKAGELLKIDLEKQNMFYSMQLVEMELNKWKLEYNKLFINQ